MRVNRASDGDESMGVKTYWRMFRRGFVVALLFCVGLISPAVRAQTGDQGAISGTVTDTTGALIPDAVVAARNNATGIETRRTASSDGLYNISPLIPGTYTVTVTANGFATFKQQNLVVNAMVTGPTCSTPLRLRPTL